MAEILSQIEHIVVVMLENRSFDTMLGWLYANGAAPPSQYLGNVAEPAQFDGLNHDLWNPQNEGFFNGDPPDKLKVMDSATSTVDPDPDPLEDFTNVAKQLYGPAGVATQDPEYPNLGFVINYMGPANGNSPVEIMEPYSPDQLPVLSGLARNYAVSDAWFCSVPSETWPNRSFVHAGTSNGHVVNGKPPDPLVWNSKTIFEVLGDMGKDWKVYSDTLLTPALTLLMFPRLTGSLDHFAHFSEFTKACAGGSLPAYSFLEPSFLDHPNDYHPPHDVVAGEQFVYQVWQAVSQSPKWNETLLIITFDEHGGTYDHVMPPWSAACPDTQGNPGELEFTFDRFGVRVPMVVVSPWIQAGTVFRSDTNTPYDHTSILATLRDWLGIPADKMLPSKRIAEAPTLAQLLTLETVRTVLPEISQPAVAVQETDTLRPTNHLQESLVAAQASRRGLDPQDTLNNVKTREQAIRFFREQGPPPQAAGVTHP